MLVYDLHLTRGIFGGTAMKENTELVQLSKKKSIIIPEGYVSAKMEREYLENDFAKFRKSYVWNPDNLHWDRAVQAFTAIYVF